MNFFNIRSIRRPSIGFSHDGRLFRWAMKKRGSEPNTYCEALLASTEGMLVAANEGIKNSRHSWISNWATRIYLLVVVAYLIFVAINILASGWMYLAIIAGGAIITVVAFTVLYIALRLAGKYLCPIGVRFSGA